MDLYLLPEQQLLFAAQDIQEMENRNRITAEFGLQLSPLEMQELCVEHAEALKNSGRVVLGGGILPQPLQIHLILLRENTQQPLRHYKNCCLKK